jgi:DNA-binding NarL/FixJ family response regulator
MTPWTSIRHGRDNADGSRRLASGRLRVVVADPDPLVRDIVRTRIEATDEYAVVAEARDGFEAVEMCSRHQPDIAVMEARMPGMNAVDIVGRVVRYAPEVRILLFTARSDADECIDALRHGAWGVLSKDGGVDGVMRALDTVAGGDLAIPRAITLRLVERMREMPSVPTGVRPVDSPLTDREWEVVDLLRAGADPSDVAAELDLSRETVYRHLKNVMRKLGVHSREEVVAVVDYLVRASLAPA